MTPIWTRSTKPQISKCTICRNRETERLTDWPFTLLKYSPNPFNCEFYMARNQKVNIKSLLVLLWINLPIQPVWSHNPADKIIWSLPMGRQNIMVCMGSERIETKWLAFGDLQFRYAHGFLPIGSTTKNLWFRLAGVKATVGPAKQWQTRRSHMYNPAHMYKLTGERGKVFCLGCWLRNNTWFISLKY